MVPGGKIGFTEVKIDILSAIFFHVNATTKALGREVTLFIRTIAIIVLVVTLFQACSNLCTNGLTSCSIVDTEVVGRSDQLETIVVISELQLIVGCKIVSILVHVTTANRHEVRLIVRIVTAEELEFLCYYLNAPARTAIICSPEADASISAGTTKGIPSGSATIGGRYRTGEYVEIIGCTICTDILNNFPIGLGIILVLNKFCFVRP